MAEVHQQLQTTLQLLCGRAFKAVLDLASIDQLVAGPPGDIDAVILKPAMARN